MVSENARGQLAPKFPPDTEPCRCESTCFVYTVVMTLFLVPNQFMKKTTFAYFGTIVEMIVDNVMTIVPKVITMWPVIFGMMRTYAPYIVWPAAAVVGVIGYNIESILRGEEKSPQKPSVLDSRMDRQLEEVHAHDPTKVDSLKDQIYQRRPIFEKNAFKKS